MHGPPETAPTMNTNSGPPAPYAPVDARAHLIQIAAELVQLEHELLGLESEMRPAIEALPSAQQASARNLVHYVALRQRELRAASRTKAKSNARLFGKYLSHPSQQ